MRNILVDHARANYAAKRGGGAPAVTPGRRADADGRESGALILRWFIDLLCLKRSVCHFRAARYIVHHRVSLDFRYFDHVPSSSCRLN